VTPRRPRERPRLPPAGDAWPLPVWTLSTDRRLYRLTRVHFPDPAYFGRGGEGRFDAPDGSYGICYLGTSLDCCLYETLPAVIDPATHTRVLDAGELAARYAAVVTLHRSLRLAHLAGDSLGRLGIDQRVTGGDDYDLSGAWSAAIHRHSRRVDGIVYPSRHQNALSSVALFDRAAPAVAFARWGRLDDRGVPSLWVMVARWLKRAGVALVDLPGTGQ
jgi:hypothetical protein